MIKNAIFLSVICAVVFLFYLPSYLQMQELHEKNRVYQKQIAELTSENARLFEERRRLEKDPDYFEKVARDKMGLIREDEVIYKMTPSGNETAVSEENAALLKKEDVIAEGEASAAAANVKKTTAAAPTAAPTVTAASTKPSAAKTPTASSSTKTAVKPKTTKAVSTSTKKKTSTSP